MTFNYNQRLVNAGVPLLSLSLLTGCVSPATSLDESAQQVHLRMDASFDAYQCRWLGEVTGSEGHWFSYLFFANDLLVQGAMNDIKNRANQIGANTVYVVAPQDFTTSFTMMGSAYWCD